MEKILSSSLGDSVLRLEEVENADGSSTTRKKLIRNIESIKRKPFSLQIGDVVERKLQNGDWVIFNRQPTLHEPSLRAKRVVIHPHSTLRMSLPCTTAYNADFDGDEMNLHVPQTASTRAECDLLMSTEAQFISAADSKPMLAIKNKTVCWEATFLHMEGSRYLSAILWTFVVRLIGAFEYICRKMPDMSGKFIG